MSPISWTEALACFTLLRVTQRMGPHLGCLVALSRRDPLPYLAHSDLLLCVCVICALLFVLLCVLSRPGQCGRCDGYILEGRELEFYVRKMQKKKKGTAAA